MAKQQSAAEIASAAWAWTDREVLQPSAANIDEMFSALAVGIEPSVLVTINSIVVALMILAVGAPPTATYRIVELQRTSRKSASPKDIIRIALYEAVIAAGSACLVSTRFLTWHRPPSLCQPELACSSSMLIFASNMTTISMCTACFYFFARAWDLTVRAPHPSDTRDGSGFLPPTSRGGADESPTPPTP